MIDFMTTNNNNKNNINENLEDLSGFLLEKLQTSNAPLKKPEKHQKFTIHSYNTLKRPRKL